MDFGLQQNLTLSQQLVMTPQLQQAIKLLQLSRLELVQMIQEEMGQNPALEEMEQQTDLEEDTNTSNKEVSDLTDKESPEVTKEITIEEKVSNDTDWESYINEYNSTGRTHIAKEAQESLNYEAFTSREKTLEEHLRWQLMFYGLSKTEEKIGSLIIGNLDKNGYFRSTVEEIAQTFGFSIDDVEETLKILQGFDPPGVCARDLSECLLTQIKSLGIKNEIINKIITDHLKNLENRNIKAIAKDLKISQDDIRAAVKVIQYLEPKPGRIFSPDESSYIIPDIFVYKDENGYKIVLNDDGLPKLKISKFYRDAVSKNKKLSKETKNYLNEKMQSASWLIKSIHQRQKTIYLVMESIIKFQQEFFDKGIAYLKPLILKDIAQDIEMHESTISRVTTNKYTYTPQGLFELKYFFNSAIKRQSGGGELASESVKEKIKLLVKNEDPNHPLSDDKIALALKNANVNIARRTIAKYRKMLRILPSNKRKQL